MWSSKSSKQEKSSKDEESRWGPTRDSETWKSEKSKVLASIAEPKRAEVVSTSLQINSKIGEMGIPIIRGLRYILKSEEQPQRNSGIPRNHLHCYGWIDCEQDEEHGQDFIYLRPATQNIEAKETTTPNLSNRIRNHNSRWDEKPNDP